MPGQCAKLAWCVTDLSLPPPIGTGSQLFETSWRASLPREIVLHFGRYGAVYPDSVGTLTLLGRTIRYILRCGRTACTIVKIVDLDKVRFSSYNYEDGPVHSVEDAQSRIVAQLEGETDRLSFLTREEYCGEYGAEAYHIETCMQLW
jgi:hypothetical protein